VAKNHNVGMKTRCSRAGLVYILGQLQLGTPGHTQKKTYVFDVQHIALIDRYAQDHRLDLKEVIYAAFQEFFERRGYVPQGSVT